MAFLAPRVAAHVRHVGHSLVSQRPSAGQQPGGSHIDRYWRHVNHVCDEAFFASTSTQ
jgi:hypothetical protein